LFCGGGDFSEENFTVTTTAELQSPFVTRSILGVNVAVSSYDEVVQHSLAWAEQRQSRALYFAAVHMVMETVDDPAFLPRLNASGTVFPDGMPLVWALHALGESSAQRVCGPDVTAILLAAAEKAGVSVGFYGGSQSALDALVGVVRLRYPKLKIVYYESPPFRALTPEEDAAIVDRITASDVRLLFVGLGCPKQEHWIVEHLGRVHAVMFAVGAAFDFIAGSKLRAPLWMQRHGLEWVFRFASEPRRLAMRYLKHNSRFVLKFLRQLLAGSA
jgi:N-acetylglucosaminyldiphosphoundecaprenol N-acetyl-beta-D-mannosaminyltransferase